MRDLIDKVMTAYETDEHQWLLEQIALLQAGKLDAVDRGNLIQYLTEMTIRDRRELRSRITVLLQHLLKVQLQPQNISQSWINSIVEQQQEISTLLESVPSLRQYIPDLFDLAYRDAVRRAMKETGILTQQFPKQSPWTLEQALTFEPPST